MDNRTTKIYENTTDKDILIRELGETIPAHDRLSVTTEYHTPINLINYPGIIDLLAHEAENGPAQAPDASKAVAKPAVPPAPGLEGNLQTDKTEAQNG